MPVFSHTEIPIQSVPRIRTRVLASAERGAAATAVWEQWIHAEGYIPPHYHEVEEVLVLLAGAVDLTLGERMEAVAAPATIIVPPRQIHTLVPRGGEEVHLLAIFPEAAPQIFASDDSLRQLPWQDFTG